MSIEIPKYLTRKELETFLAEMLETDFDDDAKWNEQRDRFNALHEGDKGSLFWMLVWKIQPRRKNKAGKKT